MSDSEIDTDEAEIVRIMSKMPEFRHLEALRLDEKRSNYKSMKNSHTRGLVSVLSSLFPA